WFLVGVTLITVSLHEVVAPPWLEALPGYLQATFWGSILITLVLVYLTGVFLWRYLDQRQRLYGQVEAAESKAADANQRLEAVLRLSHKFLDASDEREVIELL
ncbi:MAG: hypothetical protein GTN53_34840, partial [Candidatus Aminicenantes bacterium]|nr:hypothetical protein [Candidatus Aminicenantes bacterium]NIT27692.1 hypothetical protein [Candidatus Aminicenantes bacterium]